MADTLSRDPFGSGTESESEAEGQDRARTERRAKGEAAKQVEFVDETILEEDDPMDDETDVRECEDRLRRIQTGSSSTEATVEESPPIVVNKKKYICAVPFKIQDISGPE